MKNLLLVLMCCVFFESQTTYLGDLYNKMIILEKEKSCHMRCDYNSESNFFPATVTIYYVSGCSDIVEIKTIEELVKCSEIFKFLTKRIFKDLIKKETFFQADQDQEIIESINSIIDNYNYRDLNSFKILECVLKEFRNWSLNYPRMFPAIIQSSDGECLVLKTRQEARKIFIEGNDLIVDVPSRFSIDSANNTRYYRSLLYLSGLNYMN